MWTGLKDAELTFFEQTEQIADHLEQLELLVERLENPAKRAVDEAIEISFDKGKLMAMKLGKHSAI